MPVIISNKWKGDDCPLKRRTEHGIIDQLDWQDDSFVRPADDVVLAKAVELETEWNNKEYARSRAKEYPDYGTQLDYIYHNGIDKWKTDIVDPVKAKYPKPE